MVGKSFTFDYLPDRFEIGPQPTRIRVITDPVIAPTDTSQTLSETTTSGIYSVNQGEIVVVTTWRDASGNPVQGDAILSIGLVVTAVDTVTATDGTVLVNTSAPVTITAVDPLSYFGAGQRGTLTDLQDIGTLWQLSDGTVPVTTAGDPIGRKDDISGNGEHFTQDVTADRPLFATGPNRVQLNGSNWKLQRAYPVGLSGTMVLATAEGTLAYGVTIPPSSTIVLGGSQFPGTTVHNFFLREGALTPSEAESVRQSFISRGAGNNYSGATSMVSYYQSLAQYITNFPANADFSNAVDCRNAFRFFAGTTFPPLAFTSMAFGGDLFRESDLVTVPSLSVPALINAVRMYRDSTSLANAPAGVFDNCPCTNWTDAFLNTNLTTTAIDNILVSLANAAVTFDLTNGTFVQSGGSAPSATGEAAITALRARGYTITVTGGF